MRHLQALTVGALRMAALAIGLAVSWSDSADTLKYDAAWTFIYDGGRGTNGKSIFDQFMDVKISPNGTTYCVGETIESRFGSVLLVKLSKTGTLLQKVLFTGSSGARASSLFLDEKGDIHVGGARYNAPLLLRFDSSLSLKSSTWYYDSTRDRHLLDQGSTINSIFKSPNGRTIAVAGDPFPDNYGLDLNNFAAYLEFDTLGAVKRVNQWLNRTGYTVSGWSLASDGFGGLLLGGNEAVLSVDTQSVLHDEQEYTFSLSGVGTVNNRVMRVRTLRDGRRLAVGQAYEEDCWTRWKRLSYDGWWTTLSGTGRAEARNTAGVSGQDDVLYDATQLVDGRIVLVGWKPSTDQVGGIWALVTDSTSKNILWEGHIPIPYRSDKGNSATAYAVAATPDSGFTVVGPESIVDSLGGSNGFVAHFVPKIVPTSARVPQDLQRVHSNDPWTIAFQLKHPGKVDLSIYNVRGKRTARYSQWMSAGGGGKFRLEKSTLGDGISFWRLQMNGRVEQQGFFPVMHQ